MQMMKHGPPKHKKRSAVTKTTRFGFRTGLDSGCPSSSICTRIGHVHSFSLADLVSCKVSGLVLCSPTTPTTVVKKSDEYIVLLQAAVFHGFSISMLMSRSVYHTAAQMEGCKTHPMDPVAPSQKEGEVRYHCSVGAVSGSVPLDSLGTPPVAGHLPSLHRGQRGRYGAVEPAWCRSKTGRCRSRVGSKRRCRIQFASSCSNFHGTARAMSTSKRGVLAAPQCRSIGQDASPTSRVWVWEFQRVNVPVPCSSGCPRRHVHPVLASPSWVGVKSHPTPCDYWLIKERS